MEQRQEDLHITPTCLVFVINEALLIEGVKEEVIAYFQKNRDTLNLTKSSTTIERFLLFIHSDLGEFYQRMTSLHLPNLE